MTLSEGDFFVRRIRLPAHIRGVTVPNSDGTFDVYVSESLSDEEAKDTLLHEITHISKNHFYVNKEASACEHEASSAKETYEKRKNPQN